MAKPILGYWDIRGWGESIRLMLEYCGIDYEDKRYVVGDGQSYDLSDWLDVKMKLGLEFPNLPYYIDGDFRLTQSMAIMKHIARKNGLQPITDDEKDKCDMLEGILSEFRLTFSSACYKPDFETNMAAFMKGLPEKLKGFDEYLCGNEWLAGLTLTHIDFVFCEILDKIRLKEPTCLDESENLSKYVDRFFKLEKINAYRQSSRFKKFPIYNKQAHWGRSAK